MEATKMQELRHVLEQRRSEIAADVDQMGVELRTIGMDQEEEKGGLSNHLAEDASNVAEAERLTTISDDIGDVLTQIDNALERMDEGTYGFCRRCGKPINEERLEAFPYVAYCIECQSILERENALQSGA